MEEGEKEWSLWICIESAVVCTLCWVFKAQQVPMKSESIRKFLFLFFSPIWFIKHNQAIPSLDTACPSPCTGQSLLMGSLDKKVFLQAVRHKELEQNEMLWPNYLLSPLL